VPKNLLLTEVLYAGGAVQEYVVIQPQTLTGWSGADAEGEPPVPPYCPPDPNTDQGPAPPEEPPCVDVAGECIPVGKSEYIAICGYKYIDLETGQIIELSSDTQYPVVDVNSHQWLKAQTIKSPEIKSLATGDYNVVNGAPMIKGTARTVTLSNNQYTDGYDTQMEVVSVGLNYSHRYWPAILPQGLVDYNTDGTERPAWYDYHNYRAYTPPNDYRRHPLWQKLVGPYFRLFSASGGGVSPSQNYKGWSDFKVPVPFEFSGTNAYHGGVAVKDCIPWDEFNLSDKQGTGSLHAYPVNFVGTHLPVYQNSGWMNKTYPHPDATSFNWSFYGDYTYHYRIQPATEAIGWGCRGESLGYIYCNDGEGFDIWPCNCPGYGDPEAANSAKNCEWTWWDWQWDPAKSDGYFSTGTSVTVADTVNEYLNRDDISWPVSYYTGTGFKFIKLTDCEWRIIETVSTRNLPSSADIEGTVQYTYDADNKAHAWIWSNAHGWQRYGEKDYDSGDI